MMQGTLKYSTCTTCEHQFDFIWHLSPAWSLMPMQPRNYTVRFILQREENSELDTLLCSTEKVIMLCEIM